MSVPVAPSAEVCYWTGEPATVACWHVSACGCQVVDFPTSPTLAHHKARMRLGGWAIAVGIVLALGTHTVLILAGIATLVAGVTLAFRHGVTTGMWER